MMKRPSEATEYHTRFSVARSNLSTPARIGDTPTRRLQKRPRKPRSANTGSVLAVCHESNCCSQTSGNGLIRLRRRCR